jgi:hypothetical protein
MGYGTMTSEPVSDSLTPWRIAVYDALGRSVDLHPVDLERWLTTVVAPALPGAEDPAAAAFAEGRISGRRVRCLSAALQTLAHRGYAGREADHHDLRLLAQLGAAGRAST